MKKRLYKLIMGVLIVFTIILSSAICYGLSPKKILNYNKPVLAQNSVGVKVYFSSENVNWTKSNCKSPFTYESGNCYKSYFTYEKFKKLPNPPSKEGYTFDGWYTKSNGAGKKIKASSIFNPDELDTTNTSYILYAHYKANKYTVTFNLKGGSSWNSITCPSSKGLTLKSSRCTKTVTYGEYYGDLPEPTRNGYKFDGWYTDKGEPAGSRVFIHKNHTLYAKWVPFTSETRRLTFVGNGAMLEKNGKKQNSMILYCTVDAEGGCYITPPTIIRDNGEAIGWANSKSAKEAEYNIYYDPLNSPIKVDTDNKTIYAISKVRPILTVKTTSENRVLIGPNEGAKSYTTYCTYYNTEESCNAPLPRIRNLYKEKTAILGYDFSKKTDPKYNTNTESIPISKNDILYVITKNTYTASFKIENYIGLAGKSHSEIDKKAPKKDCTVYNDEKCTVEMPNLKVVERNNYSYKFLGWSKDKDKNDADSDLSFNIDTTFYLKMAKIIPLTFTIEDSKPFVNLKKKTFSEDCVLYNGDIKKNLEETTKECVIEKFTNATLQLKDKDSELIWKDTNTGKEYKMPLKIKLFEKASFKSVVKNKRTVEFIIKDTNNFSVGASNKITKTCDEYNLSRTCQMVLPSINLKNHNNKDYVADGWVFNTTVYEHDSYNEKDIELSESGTTKYYSRTKYKYPMVAKYKIEGKGIYYIDDKGKKNYNDAQFTCYLYDGASVCGKTALKVYTQSDKKKVTKWFYYDTSKKKDVYVELNGAVTVSPKTTPITLYPIIEDRVPVRYEVNLKMKDSEALSGKLENPKCDTYVGEKCITSLPDVKTKNGYEFLGWSTSSNPDVTTVVKKAGDKVEIWDSNTTYYAVTSRTVKIIYTLRDSKAATMEMLASNSIDSGKNYVSYKLYNGKNKAYIQLASLNKKNNDYVVCGWVENISTTNVCDGLSPSSYRYYDFTNKNTIKLYSNTYYAKEPVKVEFHLRNYDAAKLSGGNVIKTIEIIPNSNNTVTGASIIRTCYKYNNSSTCPVKSPKLSDGNKYYALGWNTSKTAIRSSLSSESTTNVSKNTTYYAIVKSKTPLEVIFIVKDTKTVTNSKKQVKPCTDYSGLGCSAISPRLNARDCYKALGWDTNYNATTASIPNGNLAPVTSKQGSVTYYSVTALDLKTYSVTLDLQNNSAIALTIPAIPISKKLYCTTTADSCKSCKVTLPWLIPNNGFTQLGWSTSKNSHSGSKSSGESIELTKDMTYYAITKYNIPLKATFELINTNAATMYEGNGKIAEKTCYKYNAETGCSVTSPKLYRKSNNYNISGWDTNRYAVSASVSNQGKVNISQNTKFYSIIKLKPISEYEY